MFTTPRLIIVATAVALLAGCASPNPYDNQGQADGSGGMSKTAKYGGLGALAGALAGAAIDRTDQRALATVVMVDGRTGQRTGQGTEAAVLGGLAHATGFITRLSLTATVIRIR